MRTYWKDIKGFEGLYQVNILGMVRSCNRTTIHKNGKKARYRGRILKPVFDCGSEYWVVSLHRNGKQKKVLIHRIVGETFIPNPKHLPCINHKDENPANNRLSNLEWCTYKYNDNYGSRNERIMETKRNKCLTNKN